MPAKSIDPEAIVRKARARRVPKQIAFSSVSVLAVVGVATLGITILPALQAGHDGASSSSVMATAPESSQDSGGSARDTAAKSFDARLLAVSVCGAPAFTAEPNSLGLTISVSFSDSAPTNGQEVGGTVTLTNTGPSRVSGMTAVAPTVVLSRDGMTVWHTDRAALPALKAVDLEPGQSSVFDASFNPVECAPEDDASGHFRDNLPPLSAGSYEVSAELTFVPDVSESGESFLITAPGRTIVLR
ncbi:MAG: hypothetical protein ABIW32_05895 [Terrimesophilobacter sp.]